MEHVYFLKLQPDKTVRPFIKDGSGFREGTKADFDWKAGDSVAFKPDDGFSVKVVLVKSPGRSDFDKETLGDFEIRDTDAHTVRPQSGRGDRAFGFRCTLIDEKGNPFGWLTPADDKTSGSPDGNVHN